MGKLDGKVAFITGAARGQGRSHAITLAREGAVIAAVDLGDRKVEYPPFPVATKADLNETVRLISESGGRIIGLEADVRSDDEVKAAVDQTIKEFGRIDIVVANAGISDKCRPFWEIPLEDWQGVLDINLTGVWRTCKYTSPHLIAQKSGSVIITCSMGAMKGLETLSNYASAKWGARGFMKTAALELGHYGIRVNGVFPGTCNTPMLKFQTEMCGAKVEDVLDSWLNFQIFHNIIEPADISAGVLWLASEESRFVTGLEMVIDAGWGTK